MTEQEIILSIQERLVAKLFAKTIEHDFKFKNYHLGEFLVECNSFKIIVSYHSDHLRATRLFSNPSQEYEIFNVPIFRLKDDCNLDDQIDNATCLLCETLINYALWLDE